MKFVFDLDGTICFEGKPLVCVEDHPELFRLATDRVVSDDQRVTHKILDLLNELR
ncbi:hypothetical protein M3650_14620 [Paenibacillus sp. MER TA 81-3]|uniref:hypothetical protein n=1 Tax=Paenibacillus sp. MER TA 81-3 TaxID=2939573 RepID=UPI00203F6883|nr:hypothetical protein [Paenibacillus sp. MER TA 81-3]MCM3339828.1 hypothetical protein [Paenibacillus sp. MER TA 81-3]